MKKFRKTHIKYIVLLIFIVAISILLYIKWDDVLYVLSLLSEEDPAAISEYIKSWGMVAPIISIGLMVLSSFIAPIPAFLIAGANAVIFGVAGGIIITWVGAMLGAMGTFYFSKIFGEDIVKKFQDSSTFLKKVDEISENHGAKVIFVSRLLPFVSFDLISYAAGLSSIKPWKFFVATGLGMIPGTIAYVLLGNEIMKLAAYSRQMIWITILGVIIYLVIIKFKKHYKNKKV